MDKEELNKIIGEKVWKCRVELGISRSDIAKEINVSHQQFEKYEKGMNRISVGTLAKIMEYMSISPDYFFNDIEVDPYSESQRRMCREISQNFFSIENPNHRKLLMIASRMLNANDDKENSKNKRRRKK